MGDVYVRTESHRFRSFRLTLSYSQISTFFYNVFWISLINLWNCSTLKPKIFKNAKKFSLIIWVSPEYSPIVSNTLQQTILSKIFHILKFDCPAPGFMLYTNFTVYVVLKTWSCIHYPLTRIWYSTILELYPPTWSYNQSVLVIKVISQSGTGIGWFLVSTHRIW